MKTTNWSNERGIHSQPSVIGNPQNPTSTEIVDYYLSRKFGEVDSDTRYPVRNFMSAILRILAGKHNSQKQDTGSFNSLLFAALENA